MGRKLSDALPTLPKEFMIMDNPMVHPTWRDAWSKKEDALRARYLKGVEKSQEGTKSKTALVPGETVLMQNQTGQSPLKWCSMGTVVEAGSHDQYIVKLHGSGRLTRRNRKFLKKYEVKPYVFCDQGQPATPAAPVATQDTAGSCGSGVSRALRLKGVRERSTIT